MGRLLVMSDVHGQYRAFMTMLEYIRFAPDDKLIILGDVIDRGPNSCRLLDFIFKNNNVVMIKGNHEEMFFEYMHGRIDEGTYLSDFVGGKKTLASYTLDNVSVGTMIEHLDKINSLDMVMVDGKYVFSHAGYDYSSGQTNVSLMWDQNKHYLYPGFKDSIIIFGHTGTNMIRSDRQETMTSEPEIWYDNRYKNKIGIDCVDSSASKKRIACLDLTNKLEHYVDVYYGNKKTTRRCPVNWI